TVQLSWLLRPAVALLAIPGLIIGGRWRWLSAAIAVIALLLCMPPKNVKKPLVYTARVKRLLVTAGIITAALCFLPLLLCRNFSFLTAVVPLLSPFIVLLADLINRPIEKSINLGFINEARDMIDSSPELTVIGVTGSFGKTSVKFILGKMLSAKYGTLITPESYNTTLGVVRTIREKMRATHEYFVCEMGARNRGDIKEICELVHPKHGIITAIGEQHLESFGSIEAIKDTKFELADSLPAGGKLFVNTDSAGALERAQAKYPGFIGYGTLDSSVCRYFAHDITVSDSGSHFFLRTPDGELEMNTRLLGRHNVVNIAGAAAVALEMGVEPLGVISAAARLEAVPHRLQLIKNSRGIVIDDAYNSNPSGARAALDVLSGFYGLRVLVTPGMVELGEKEESENRALGEYAASRCDVAVLVGARHTQPIREGLLSAGFDENNIIVTEDLISGMNEAGLRAGDGRAVYLLENDLPDNYL
ncbi:MAG: UDP-N-acetylmuramoyl-tripeptide--D-alanyl-D-alanine ligase, partial [Oscillospiraceae bacterium]|nr:UDP-N-acetylmuramoyl-tripeptide--D-alanyl-D-alanine ligase [Oscillospiraceae bacterium]